MQNPHPNLTTNITNNVVNLTIVQPSQANLQGLVASLRGTLNNTVNITPVQSILAATEGDTTLEDGLAEELEEQTADVAAELRAQGENVRSQFGLQNPQRNTRHVTVEVALVAIRKEGSSTTHTNFLTRSRHPIFKAEELTSIRFLCTEALLASSVHGLHTWAHDTPWTQLKEHLMVYLPGHHWQRWVSPGETVFAEWYEDVVARGHIQDILMRVGVEEETAARLGAMDRVNTNTNTNEAGDSQDETIRILTEGTEMQEGVERDY